jgi:Uma2 family endonuclease
MIAPALRLHYSFAEYVRFQARAGDKHEYVGGLILAMAGGTLEHGRLCASVVGALVSQLRGRPCGVFDSNARVRVAASGNAYYPDASVVCGRLEADAEDGLSMINPTLLVEVLSPSTAEYDRTDKLADYRRIPSLCHIVHVVHDEPRIDVWTRNGDVWSFASFGPGSHAELGELECSLDVAEIYRDPLSRQ